LISGSISPLISLFFFWMIILSINPGHSMKFYFHVNFVMSLSMITKCKNAHEIRLNLWNIWGRFDISTLWNLPIHVMDLWSSDS
jgi:hypothetical protein